MRFVILLVVVFLIFLLARYFTIIVKRMAAVYGPVVVPRFKKLYQSFLNVDEKIAGTDRKPTGTAYNKSDRYVDVKNPYKRVSVVAIAMLLSVLSLYINKPIGIFLITFWCLNLIKDIIFLPFRKMLGEGKAEKIFNSSLIQIALALVLTMFFENELRTLIYNAMHLINNLV
ncbi:MAG: hypothetical protein ACI39R_03360 [Lachnospiraceae bacterium]